jgi:S1-C subfamily serine protease
VADGPADQAGIRDGDIITALDGTAVDRDHTLDHQLLRYRPGEELTLSVFRDGEDFELAVTLGTRPADIGG